MPPRPTTSDWLQRAATLAGAGRNDALLQAEAAARFDHDWQEIADAWAAGGDRAAAERCLAAALQAGAGSAWAHHRAAATWLRLGDSSAAVRVLSGCEARLLAAKGSGRRWLLLAQAWAGLFQDHVAVRRCLEAGRAQAAEAGDFAAVAEGFLELLGERAAAVELVEAAEHRAANAAVREHWSVACAWAGLLGDPVRAHATLVVGLRRARDVDGCLRMVCAWAHHDCSGAHVDGMRQCLAKARDLAKTFAEWFEIAETAQENGAGAAEVRIALQRAMPLATPSERRNLARAFRDWLGDADAAAALGPVGLTAAEFVPSGPSPLGWQCDVGALLDWLRTRIGRPQLETIARCDGGMGRAQNLAILLEVVQTGRMPVPLEWYPREVLSLSQHDDGERTDHVARAFCCTLLCLGELAPERYGGVNVGVEPTLPLLMESCDVLGSEALARLPGLLVAFIEGRASAGDADSWDPIPAFATLALLLAAARLDPGDPRLEGIAARLLELEAELASQDCYPHPEHGFVLGTTHFTEVAIWQDLVREILSGLQVPEDKPSLARVVRQLLEGERPRS